MNLLSKKKMVFTVLFILLFSTLSFPLVSAQEETEQVSAKAHLIVTDDKVPAIQVNNETAINLRLVDDYDFNWTFLKSQFSELWMKVGWRFLFVMPEIGRYLDYNTINLDASVVDQNLNPVSGWEAKVEPNVISGTTQGMEHDIKILAKTFRTGVEYSVLVKVILTRIDAWGDVEGTSEIYLPVKAAAYNDILMRVFESTIRTAPKSIVSFDIELENNGYYEDIFRFETKAEDGLVGIFDYQGVYIKPGESKKVKLKVMTPENLFDTGTPHKVDIYATSRLNQTVTYVGSVTVITEGFHISPLFFVIMIVIIAIIVIVALIYKNRGKIFKRDKKEKKEGFLSNLFSEKNKEKPKETKKEEPEKKKKTKEKTVDKKVKSKGFFSSLFEKKEPKKEDKKEKTKNKEKPKETKKEEQPETKDKKEEIKKPVKKQKKPSKEQLKKQRELEKIKRKQEKQKRKFNK